MHQRYLSYREMLAHRALDPNCARFAGGLITLTACPQPDGTFAVALEAEKDHGLQELVSMAETLEEKRRLDEEAGKNPAIEEVVFTTEPTPEEVEKGLDPRVADAIVSREVVLELVRIVGPENTYLAA